MRTLPSVIATGCPELDQAWAAYSSLILHRSQIFIPDTHEDLNWHAFLGHGIDIPGFRGGEFVGVDPLTRKSPKFVSLKQRGIGVPQLAALWEIPDIAGRLWPAKSRTPMRAALNELRLLGGESGASLADAFEHFPGAKSFSSLRNLLQNAALLKRHAYSFRRWLEVECAELGVVSFPPSDFQQPVVLFDKNLPLESALRIRLGMAFYLRPAIAAAMICDWQLWLWREGQTSVFSTFVFDSRQEEFIIKFGRGGFPANESGFTRWWLGLFSKLPPRLASECICLAIENKDINSQ
jgi:hypothetical protein